MRLIIIILFTFSVLILTSCELKAQSFSPSHVEKSFVLGSGIHSSVSVTNRNTNIIGAHVNLAYLLPKIGIALVPQFNFIQFESISGSILSGTDFTTSILGLYRINQSWAFGGGLDIQFAQNVDDSWETVNDLSLKVGAGYNWILGRNNISISSFFNYNPSAKDLSIGIDLSYNFPF